VTPIYDRLYSIIIIIIVLHPYAMPALTSLTRVSTQPWLGSFSKKIHFHQNGKEMWLSRKINNTEHLHHCLLLVIGANFYTRYTSCHNLMCARHVEHVEFMQHGEPIVKPDITGPLLYNIIIYI